MVQPHCGHDDLGGVAVAGKTGIGTRRHAPTVPSPTAPGNPAAANLTVPTE